MGDKAYTYLSLVGAARIDGRVTHKALLRLGEVRALRESGQLDRIVGALQSHADDTWPNPGDLEIEWAPGFGAVATLWSLLRRLGLDELFGGLMGHRTADALGDTVFVMIANRRWHRHRNGAPCLSGSAVTSSSLPALRLRH
ncbi:MAG: hypothetical protein GY708_18135 [Actinomycetia bacterium]|nr:hypothetical protein [Actinomycetes bacterium]